MKNLKETIRSIMKEESGYQDFFRKALEKAGKSIPSMSDSEKKAFFNKIDAAWDGKGEKNEELTGKQHKLDVDGDGEIEASDLAALRAGKKADESVNDDTDDGYDRWASTRVNARHIFRMLKKNYGGNISKMKDGLEDILKSNKVKGDQAEIVRQEFHKYFKIKESVNESIKYNNDGFVTQMINAAGKVVKDITLDGETFSLKGNKYVSKKGGKDLHKSHFGITESVNEAFKHTIHIDTPTQVVSKPIEAQIKALAKKGVRSKEIGLEMGFTGNAKLVTDKFQKLKNKIYFELDGKDESVNEGNAFGMAVSAAKKEGLKEFEFSGKTYKVKKGSYEKNEAAKKLAEKQNVVVAENTHVVVSMAKNGYGTLMSGAVDVKKAEKMKKATSAPRGEEVKVITVVDAKNMKSKLIGGNTLK